MPPLPLRAPVQDAAAASPPWGHQARQTRWDWWPRHWGNRAQGNEDEGPPATCQMSCSREEEWPYLRGKGRPRGPRSGTSAGPAPEKEGPGSASADPGLVGGRRKCPNRRRRGTAQGKTPGNGPLAADGQAGGAAPNAADNSEPCSPEEKSPSRSSRRRRARREAGSAGPSSPGHRAVLPTSRSIPSLPLHEFLEKDWPSARSSSGSCAATKRERAAPVEPSTDLLAQDPLILAENPLWCAEAIERLENSVERNKIVDWLIVAARPLALDKQGTRVVQKALEVAQGEGKTALMKELSAATLELIESKHGNHAITRAVEVSPPSQLGEIIEKVLTARGGPIQLSRHRYSCRLLERLVEHCSERELSQVLDQVVEEASVLSRNPYANYVVQSIMEHGSPARKWAIFERLLSADMPVLAKHRSASHVVQKALDYADKGHQDRIITALLQDERPECTLIQVACNRYGSFVLETLALKEKWPPQASISPACGPSLWKVRARLEEDLLALGTSIYGRKVAQRFNLPLPDSCSAAEESQGQPSVGSADEAPPHS